MRVELKRVAVLASRLSGYAAACLRCLGEDYGVERLVFRWRPSEEAPFDASNFAGIGALYAKQDVGPGEMMGLLEAFQPQALLVSGWIDADYLRIARRFKRQGVPVVAGSDTQWRGTLRQRVGQLLAPWYLRPGIDVLWVAGERQRQLAKRLGYVGERCWSGLYACDWDRFACSDVGGHAASSAPAFLYVGRYAEQKGLDVLVAAYRQYRAATESPWRLVCAGTGACQPLLAGIEGIEDRGFVQPEKLPALMRDASAFVLPSREEPWGVVLQEAAASGLPLICSDACGAAVHLLQDRYNGFLFQTGDAPHLASRMVRLSEMPRQERTEMARRSHELSRQFTPQRWAATLVEGLADLTRWKAPRRPAPFAPSI